VRSRAFWYGLISSSFAACLAVDGYRARIERLFVFDLLALDWNCPQHNP
jgi:hypothetical protein